MHVLFNIDNPSLIPLEISEDAVKAADSFVDICLQHAAYLGGKGNFQEAIEDINKGDYTVCIHYIVYVIIMDLHDVDNFKTL